MILRRRFFLRGLPPHEWEYEGLPESYWTCSLRYFCLRCGDDLGAVVTEGQEGQLPFKAILVLCKKHAQVHERITPGSFLPHHVQIEDMPGLSPEVLRHEFLIRFPL